MIQLFLLGQVTSLCSHCSFKPLYVADGDFWWLWPVCFHPCSYSKIKDHPKAPGQQLQALPLSKPLRFLHIVSHFQLSHPTLNTVLYPSSKPFFFFGHTASHVGSIQLLDKWSKYLDVWLLFDLVWLLFDPTTFHDPLQTFQSSVFLCFL